MFYDGFYGQLDSTFYPEIYQEVNNYLNQDKSEFNILYFPWHGYMDYIWSKQRLQAVGFAVFDKPVIQGSDPMAHVSHPVHRYITFLLNNQRNIRNFGELVSLINVKYIIIDKTSLAPKQPYEFLYDQDDLEVVIDSDLVVFKNKVKIAKIYQVDSLLTIDDWSDLLTRNVSQEKLSLDYEKKSPIEYILKETPNKRYIVFTSTYSENWRYDEQKPVDYLKLINVFNVTQAKKIYWGKFDHYLIGYIISFFSLIGIVAFKREKCNNNY